MKRLNKNRDFPQEDFSGEDLPQKPNLLISILRNVDPPWFPSGLRPAGQVNSVSEEAVPGHSVANNSCHHFSRVNSDCDSLEKSGSERLLPQHSSEGLLIYRQEGMLYHWFSIN